MLKLRVMTLNLGGGVKNFTGSPEKSTGKAQALAELVNEIKPDFLGVQEVAQYIDADGGMHSMVERLRLDSSLITPTMVRLFHEKAHANQERPDD